MNVRDFVEHYAGTFEFREWAKENSYYKQVNALHNIATSIAHWEYERYAACSQEQKKALIAECAVSDGAHISAADVEAILFFCEDYQRAGIPRASARWALEEQAQESFFTRYEAIHGDEIDVVPSDKSLSWLYEVTA